MCPAARVSTVVYWLALTGWVSVLVAAGVAATGVFTVLPDLELQVQGYVLETPAEHGRLAAGKVMEPIFAFVDVAQVAAAGLVVLMMIIQFTAGGMKLRAPANLVRVVCIATAGALLAARMAIITPHMNQDLRGYWDAAAAGDTVMAHRHREAFDARHPTASRMFNVTLVLLLAAVGASALAPGSPAGLSCDVRLEEPRLLKRP